MLGEYLGEGLVKSVPQSIFWMSLTLFDSDDEHVAVMHAFIDMMDFRDTLFVDSLRHFLQAFRLPGEAQKIDRFMLKFAERYIDGNVKTPFANAGLYILPFPKWHHITSAC